MVDRQRLVICKECVNKELVTKYRQGIERIRMNDLTLLSWENMWFKFDIDDFIKFNPKSSEIDSKWDRYAY